jgi:hypothetical protein
MTDPKTLFLGYTHQYNASFQYEFTRDLIVEATYMGNQGRRLHNGSLYRNQPTQSGYEDPKLNPTAWVWDAGSAASAGAPYPYNGFSGYAGFAVMPFPHVAAVTWGPIYGVGTPKGESGYWSTQFQLTKRMSSGLAAQMSYNISRAVGNSETAFDETWDATGGIQNIYNLTADASTVLSYDQTHIFKGYVQYQLPFGRGRKFLSSSNAFANALLGGWDVTWIFKYNTGVPLAVNPNVSYPGWNGDGGLGGAIYADFNPSVDLSRQFTGDNFNPGTQNDPGNLYFDRSAFANPTNHKLGNGKRRYEELRGFGWASEDIGIMKYWRFTETASLQLRAEFINVFNRHYYANPNTGLGNTTNFGYVTGMTGTPRNVQIGLRLGF